MRFDFVSFRVMRQQQREPYTGNLYVRFMGRVEAGNRFFLFCVCLAWPFAWWCKPTFLNCLFRGIVEDDPEGLAPCLGWQAYNREVMGEGSCRQNRRPKRK